MPILGIIASSVHVAVAPSAARFIIGGISGAASGPYMAAYNWDDISGYGAAYSAPTGLTKNVTTTRMNPDKNVVVTSSTVGGATDTVTAFSWSATSGFGTKYSGISLNAQAGDAKFNPDNSSIVVATGNNPSVLAWGWTNASGFGTQYTSWTTGPTNGSLYGATFNIEGTAVVAVQGGTTPSLMATAWSNSTGFGTNYSDGESTLSNCYQPTFTPQGTSVVYGTNAATVSQRLVGRPWSNSTGFGTRFSFPNIGTSSTTGTPQAISINSLGTVVFFGSSAAPTNYIDTIQAWSFSNSTGFGTKYSSTASGGPLTAQINSTDTAVIGVASSITTTPTTYPIPTAWSNSTGWGTTYAAPAGNPWTATNRAQRAVFN